MIGSIIIAEKIVESKPAPDENWRNVEEIVILSKKKEILNDLRQMLYNGIP